MTQKLQKPQSERLSLEHWVGTSRILALVFTDVVDSTRLGRAVGDEQWILVLRKHVAKARSLMNADTCYEIKMIGDSFMVAFRSAIDALDFALAFHADSGDEVVRIRCGIHVGPVRVFENDLFGMMINYTKRVESTENPELIVVTDEAKNHIDNEKASRHATLKFHARQVTLKGFDTQQRVWRVWYPGALELLAQKKRKAKGVMSTTSPALQIAAKILLG